jgi:tetratricopeptide (TPR) repeat protein
VLMLNPLASLHAMQGEFELADELLVEANETLDQLGSMGWVSHHEALVRLLEGEPALAEVPLRAGVEKLASMSDRGLLATTLAMLAQAVYAQGQLDEAAQLCRMAAGAGAAEDLVTQVIWRGVEAKVLARRGRPVEAENLAREAVALVAPTDLLSHHGDAMLDLAEVLRTLSRRDEYQGTVLAALSLYERKGNVIGAARARSLLGHQIRGT